MDGIQYAPALSSEALCSPAPRIPSNVVAAGTLYLAERMHGDARGFNVPQVTLCIVLEVI